MERESGKDNLREIVASDPQALEQRSASLARRGLRALSGWDATTIIEVGKEITSADDAGEVLRIIKEKIEALFRPPSLALLLVDETEERLYYAIATGNNCEGFKVLRGGMWGVLKNRTVPISTELIGADGEVYRQFKIQDEKVMIGQGLAGYVAKERNSVVAPDLRKDARFSAQLEQLPEKDAHSVVAVPVHIGDKSIGVIELFNCIGPKGFPEGDLSLLQSLADFAAIAIENCRKRLAEVERANQAESFIFDSSADLRYNGQYVNPRLESAIRRCLWHNSGYEFSLVAIELEDLKNLAESMSYRLFDKLVTQIVSEMIVSGHLYRTPDIAMGTEFPQDFVFRYGESQFDSFLSLTTKEDASVRALGMHKLLRETVWLKEAGLNVRLPVRIAVANCPADFKSTLGLRNCLEEALQLVRDSGRDGVASANVGLLDPL